MTTRSMSASLERVWRTRTNWQVLRSEQPSTVERSTTTGEKVDNPMQQEIECGSKIQQLRKGNQLSYTLPG